MRSNSSYVITPDAFSVHPGLVGRPLARPARRLTAMLLDLTLVTILVHMAGPMLLALACTWFAFRAAGRYMGVGKGMMGRWTRLTVRAAGALLLFVVAASLWNRGADAVRDLLRQRVTVASMSTAGGDSVRVSALEAVGIGAQAAALQRTEDEDEARRLVGEMTASLRQTGMRDQDIESTIRDFYDAEPEERQDWLGGIVRSTLAPPAQAAPAAGAPDSLARAYAAAVEAGDTAAANALRPRVASALARDSLNALRGELNEARREQRESARELQKLQDRGLLASLLHFLEDLGIGFGWSGLYFTAFVALWNGQTPAKRMLGIRVVRLDGKPMTWWSSFERFGGYAAGLVTGLLGFAQVYWDRNRQMIHDKIVETVVVRERPGAPEPATAPAPSASAAYTPYADRRTSTPRRASDPPRG